MKICLWSGPRNISTALMYSFAQRPDTQVYDEPLYAHYLAHSDAHAYHPGAESVLACMEQDGTKVVANMLAEQPKPVVFYKHMTHHLVELDWDFMKDMTNVILTRDPRDMLPSYAENIEHPTMHDVGYAKHLDLLQYLETRGLPTPIILDSKFIQNDPEGVLRKLCEQLGIPFTEKMLRWKAAPLPEDGVWAPYWYKNVHKSTGFKPYQAKTAPFPEHLKPLLTECLPIYEKLQALALR